MHIIRMLVVGLIVGILARFFYPGPVHLGWLYSIVLGIAGSFVAGFAIKAVNRNSGEPMHPAGFIASIIGAMVLIWLGRVLGLNF
jgi:uncharacterized membrane protein YeaQ/YmgE (transglycosylase-associated protein family)